MAIYGAKCSTNQEESPGSDDMADEKPRYKAYQHPAGGWGAAGATAKVLLEQSVVTKGSRTLLAMNHPGGFKCPS